MIRLTVPELANTIRRLDDNMDEDKYNLGSLFAQIGEIKMIKWMSITVTAFMLAFGLPGCTTVQEKPLYVAKEPGPPPWAPAHGYRAKHHYYYYPGPGVYYDVDRKIYFYTQGGEWKVSASLPVGIRLDVHSYTVLDMDADKPYVYHGEVAKRYPPGQLKKAEKGNGNKGKGNKGD